MPVANRVMRMVTHHGRTVVPPFGASASIEFPVDPQQNCAFCGSQDWSELLPLLAIPAWRAKARSGLPWFWVACAVCGALVDAAKWDELVQRMNLSWDGAVPRAAREELAAFQAFRSPLLRITREEARASRPTLFP
jgi:hypothetical protein